MTDHTSDTFQVDLRGLVDLLSRHLYSSPKVYVRELLQNGVDAVTERGTTDDRPAILLTGADTSADGRMHCFDAGVGLDEADVRTFLATIGRSSKRDDLGLARTDMLGQFGIGLLSAFLVTDEIEVLSRKGDGPVVRWRGRGDGSYVVDQVTPDPADPRARWLAAGPGTCVALAPRRGEEEWLAGDRVVALAREYGRFLPLRVEASTRTGTTTIAPVTPPWLIGDPGVRRTAVRDLGVAELGIPPFATVPVSVPAAGLHGVALILGNPTHSGRRPGSRVYLKGMLLGDEMSGLLPEWAFFARLVVDTTQLRPTASREALYSDELLADTRTALGDQLRRWLARLAETEPQRLTEFLQIHHVAAKGMALADDEMLRVLLPVLPFETNSGEETLPDLARRSTTVYVTRTVDDFRQVAQVGAGQGMEIVNGGYVYTYDLVLKAAAVLPGARVVPLSPDDLDAHIRTVEASRESDVAWPLGQMRAALDRLDVDLELRGFSPASVPALYLDSETAQERRERRAVQEKADDTWAAILGAFDDGTSDRPRLLLNDENQTVRRLLEVRDPGLAAMGVESLYARALLMGHHRLRAADLAALDRSFLGLLDRAMGGDRG
ncbi:MAG TPA: HSP90 family protein [Propionibacteriaceae bacterium]|nr:HSP90 family protein [Propionibacteriaceae bacterium]